MEDPNWGMKCCAWLMPRFLTVSQPWFEFEYFVQHGMDDRTMYAIVNSTLALTVLHANSA